MYLFKRTGFIKIHFIIDWQTFCFKISSLILTTLLMQDNSIETIKRKAYSLEVINSFATALMEATTEDDIVWCIPRHAISKLGYDDCVIYLIDSNGVTLSQRAALGQDKNPAKENIKNALVLNINEGICGRVAATGVPEIIHDTSLDIGYIPDDAVRLSEIVVPIIGHEGKVLDVIDSEHPEKGFYGELDLEILSTVAKMAATKLDQARALNQIKRHKDQLQEKVDKSTAELRKTISELQRSNEEIERRNQEKETLLKEIHHRVKNNLQIVSSILTLQAAKSKLDIENDVFLDCQNRIKSMAIIHEQLYDKGNLAQIATDQYIQEIAGSLAKTYKNQCDVHLSFALNRAYLSIEQSVPFGLILNEILVNCFKHAFRGTHGVLRIALNYTDEEIILIVKDSGTGFDDEEEFDTLGIGLIQTLTEQLEGTISFDSDSTGTSVVLRFPTSN